MPLAKTRKPYPKEMEFFKSRPDVGGYAAPDDSVVLNPYSGADKQAIVRNELARIYMRNFGGPSFGLTQQQQGLLGAYSQNPQDVRDTLAARLYSGDPSAGTPTLEQQMYVNKLRELIARTEGYRTRR